MPFVAGGSGHVSNDAAGTTLVLNVTPTTGNLLASQTWYNNGSSVGSLADNVNGSHTQVDQNPDAFTVITQDTYYKKAITGGATAITLTTTSVGFRRLQTLEYSGLDTASPLNDHKVAAQHTSTGGANAETSGNGAGTSVNGCTIVSFITQVSDTTAPTAGTGFTARDPFNNAAGDASDGEDRVQATAGVPDAGTWTLAAGKFTFVAMMAFAPAATSILTAPMMPAYIWGRNKIQLARPHVDANITSLNNYVLAAATGVYTLAGSSASTLRKAILAAATGTYNLTGIAALTAFGHKLLAATGVFTLTGSAASTLATRLLAAATGAFALTGNAAKTVATRILNANTGSFTLTGNPLTVVRTYVLNAAKGVFTFTGAAASTIYSAGVSAVSDWIVRLRRRRR